MEESLTYLSVLHRVGIARCVYGGSPDSVSREVESFYNTTDGSQVSTE